MSIVATFGEVAAVGELWNTSHWFSMRQLVFESVAGPRGPQQAFNLHILFFFTCSYANHALLTHDTWAR